MTQDYASQIDLSQLLPKLYAIKAIGQIWTHIPRISHDYGAYVPELIDKIAEQVMLSFLIGVDPENWGDEQWEGQLRYLSRLGTGSLVVLEAVADPTEERLDKLVSKVQQEIKTDSILKDGGITRLLSHTAIKNTGIPRSYQDVFLEEQVASQYGRFMAGFFNFERQDIRQSWESHYANELMNPGIGNGQLDTAVQLLKFNGFDLDMDGKTYSVTPMGYVDVAKYFMNALTSLKGYLMAIVKEKGLGGVTDEAIKEGIRQYFGSKQDFLYYQRLNRRITDASFMSQIVQSKEKVRKWQNEHDIIKLFDEGFARMAESIFID